MDATAWWLFLVTATALALVPGPAVLCVVGAGLRGGRRAALGATLGVLGANALYFAASAAGLGLLLVAAAPWFVALKWTGAVYLAHLGIAALRAPPPAIVDADAGVAAARRSALGAAAAWRAALLLQLGNPKAILFFTALLPPFVRADAGLGVAAQVGVLAVTSIASEFAVLLGYGALGAHAARSPRVGAQLQRASGVCLLGCAALALAA